MKFSLLLGTVALSGSVSVASPSRRQQYPPDEVDILARQSMHKLREYLKKSPSSTGCTLETAAKRQEWSDMSPFQRTEYIRAVQCLMHKPPISPPDVVPGARSRYDDFVATHINQTLTIHATANFLSWHRYYVWVYEKALREECGYTGWQPYWNWNRYAADPASSPLFDGSATSISGNGEYVAYGGVPVPGAPAPYDVIPPGVGGGCVTKGPFANMSVNLGPKSATVPDVPANPRSDGMGYNPRCLRRDLNPHSAAVTTVNYTYSLITENNDIYWFETVMQGQFNLGLWGVHTGGHFTIGGDPGGDFFASPGDPGFWLHHGMIDRVWWIWQLQDLEERTKAVSGTITMFNDPPSRNGTLDDDVDIGFNAPALRLGDLLDTVDGPFCYIYV